MRKMNGLKFLNLSVEFPKKKRISTNKTLVNWNLNFSQVTSFYSNPAFSTEKLSKNQ